MNAFVVELMGNTPERNEFSLNDELPPRGRRAVGGDFCFNHWMTAPRSGESRSLVICTDCCCSQTC